MDCQAEPPRDAKCHFLGLPRELRDQIYSYLIPTEKLFIFLLLNDEGEHFTFDRGYAFPLFQTSFLSACSRMNSEGMEWWLREGHFRLEMGENLGLRNPKWKLSSSIIGRMRHCDFRLVVPFYPYELYGYGHLQFDRNLQRRLLKRFRDIFVQGKSLRQMEFSLDKAHAQTTRGARILSGWEVVVEDTHRMACDLYTERLLTISNEVDPIKDYLEPNADNIQKPSVQNEPSKIHAKKLNITYKFCNRSLPVDMEPSYAKRRPR